MLELAGPLAVAALVLAAGGLFKLRDPEPTQQMLTAIGLPGRGALRVLAILSGFVELALGLATFFIGGSVLAACTAAAFVTFAVLAARLVRAPSPASCGCFGRHSGRTTWLHVAIDAAIAGLALAAAIGDAPGFANARPELAAAGVPFVGLAVLGAWFVVAALTVLPEALVAARPGPRATTVRTFEITGTS